MTRRTGIIAFLALLIAVAYGLSVANDFVFDDLIFVTRDPRVQSLTETPRLFVEPLWGFSDAPGDTHAHQYYRPLQTAPLALNLAVAGKHAWPSHLLNLVVHGLNTLLFLSILLRLGIDPRIGLATAAVWAVHPGWSEAVLWISDIAGLGAAFAILAILRLHMETASSGRSRAPTVSMLFFIGLLCKEVAIVAPLVLLMHDWLLRKTRTKNTRARVRADYLAMLPAAALYAVLRTHALGGMVPGLGQNSLGPAGLVVNGFGLLPEFAHTLLWPFALSMYHDFTPVEGAGDPRLWCGIVLAAAVAGTLVLSLAKGNRKAAFACAWLMVTTLPYLLVRWPKLNVYAERYTYLPSMGVFMLAALAMNGFGGAALRNPRPALRRVLVASWSLLLALFVVVDISRTRDWHDEVSLYTKTLSTNGRAELVRNNLALRYLELGRYDDGLVEIDKLLAIDPDFAEAHHNLGLLSLAVGDLPHALSAFQRAHELAPTKPETLLNLGYVYDRLGKRANAVAAYWRLTELNPDHAAAWYNLALAALDTGQWANARYALSRVLAIDPADPAALALQPSLAQTPRERAIDIAVTQRRCKRARDLIGSKDYRDAEASLQAAAWLDERSALPHHYLANLYYLRGKMKLALRETREALARAPNNPLYRNNMRELANILSNRMRGGAKP